MNILSHLGAALVALFLLAYTPYDQYPGRPGAPAGFHYDQTCLDSLGTAAVDEIAWEASSRALRYSIDAIQDQLDAEQAFLDDMDPNQTVPWNAQKGLVIGLQKAVGQLDRAWYETVATLDANFHAASASCLQSGDGGGGGSTTGGQNGDRTTPPPPHIKPIGVE
jgi:hypothetical protein